MCIFTQITTYIHAFRTWPTTTSNASEKKSGKTGGEKQAVLLLLLLLMRKFTRNAMLEMMEMLEIEILAETQ